MRKALLSFPLYISCLWTYILIPGYLIWLWISKHPFSHPFSQQAYIRLAFYCFFYLFSFVFSQQLWRLQFERPAKMMKEYVTRISLLAGIVLVFSLPTIKVVANSELLLEKPVTITGTLTAVYQHGNYPLPYPPELGIIPGKVDQNADISPDSEKKGLAFKLGNSDQQWTTPFFYNQQILKDTQERFQKVLHKEIAVTYYPISKRIVSVKEGTGPQAKFILYDDIYGKR